MFTTKDVAVEDPITKLFPSPAIGLIASFANGDVVPIEIFPPKYELPVVVAPPDIVRPPACVPSPMVDDASEYIPLVKPMSVDVEFAFVAPNSVLVNGKSAPTPPDGHDVLQSVDIHIEFADIAVVDANGKVEVVDVVAVKYEPTTWPTTESFAYGDDVPIPTRPIFVTLNLEESEF